MGIPPGGGILPPCPYFASKNGCLGAQFSNTTAGRLLGGQIGEDTEKTGGVEVCYGKVAKGLQMIHFNVGYFMVH